MSIFTEADFIKIENEFKSGVEITEEEAKIEAELKEASVEHILQAFEIYAQAAKEYAINAERFGITPKTYRTSRSVFSGHTPPLFDIKLWGDNSTLCSVLVSQDGEIWAENPKGYYYAFNDLTRNYLKDIIKARSEKLTTYRKSGSTPDILDTLRLLAFHHSDEEYDFVGNNVCKLYLEKPKSADEVTRLVKEKFIAIIKENRKK